MTHSIERQEIIFLDAEVVTQKLEARLENTRLGILVGHTKHDDSAPVVVIKVNAF